MQTEKTIYIDNLVDYFLLIREAKKRINVTGLTTWGCLHFLQIYYRLDPPYKASIVSRQYGVQLRTMIARLEHYKNIGMFSRLPGFHNGYVIGDKGREFIEFMESKPIVFPQL